MGAQETARVVETRLRCHTRGRYVASQVGLNHSGGLARTCETLI